VTSVPSTCMEIAVFMPVMHIGDPQEVALTEMF
jgi:hypothetical protein